MLQKILKLGQVPEMSAFFVKRLKAINIMLFVCAGNCLLYSVILYVYDMPEISYIIFTFSLTFFFLIYLQVKQQAYIVRAVLLVFLNLFILFFRLILNKQVEIELLFSLLMILPLLFYQYTEYKKWLLFSGFSLILLFISMFVPELNWIDLDQANLVIINNLVWVTLFIWVVVLFYWVSYEYGKTEIDLLAKNDSLKLLLDAYQIKEKELVNVNTLLIDRYNELEHIVHIISHDLKEPVQTILTGTDVLRAPDMDSEIKVQLASAVSFAKEELTHMFHGIRRFSSVCKEKGTSHVSLNTIINDIVAEYDDSKRLKVIAVKLPSVLGVSDDFKVLFEELISNSIKFNLNEQVVVNILAKKNKEGDFFEIEYTDNSIGFKNANEGVFKMFYRQVDKSGVNKRGVGLAIMKKIVNFYGGKIRCCSQQKQGVRIMLTLPT